MIRTDAGVLDQIQPDSKQWALNAGDSIELSAKLPVVTTPGSVLSGGLAAIKIIPFFHSIEFDTQLWKNCSSLAAILSGLKYLNLCVGLRTGRE